MEGAGPLNGEAPQPSPLKQPRKPQTASPTQADTICHDVSCAADTAATVEVAAATPAATEHELHTPTTTGTGVVVAGEMKEDGGNTMTTPAAWEACCRSAVIRIGELFGEFGILFADDANAQAPVDVGDCVKWHLYVRRVQKGKDAAAAMATASLPPLHESAFPSSSSPSSTPPPPLAESGEAETGSALAKGNASKRFASEVVFNEVLDMARPTKVIKLEPGTRYVAVVRGFNRQTATWSAWSPPVQTTTLFSVTTLLPEIGEDYVRVQWGRAPRDTYDIAPEQDPRAARTAADIARFELRVLREKDMIQEYCSTFESGIRANTVRGLAPGTAYIVMTRYGTLIHTLTNWHEVGRFMTTPAICVELATCGEEALSVRWHREALPAETFGYAVSSAATHQYEVCVESRGLYFDPVQVAATVQEYRFTDLFPSTTYKVYVRGLSEEGHWGSKSNVLTVRTADRPEVALLAAGETFLSFTWSRPQHNEEEETKVEYCVQSLNSAYKQQSTCTLARGPRKRRSSSSSSSGGGGPDAAESTGSGSEVQRVFHVESLKGGADYSVAIRTLVNGEWGRWTEGRAFSTLPQPTLTFLERGEDFFALRWPATETTISGRRTSASSVTDSTAAPRPTPTVKAARFNVVVNRVVSKTETREEVLNTEIFPDPAEPGFRVNHLESNTAYEVVCRAWQHNPSTGYEGWGDFSLPVRLKTLQSVALRVWDIGEDFAHIGWRRGLLEGPLPGASGTSAEKSMTSVGSPTAPEESSGSVVGPSSAWSGLKYEIVVGCMDSGDDEILHCQVLETNYCIANLQPATTYIVSVRACDKRNQWGLWSRLKLRTLSGVVTSLHEIGEDFVRLTWQRPNYLDDVEGTADGAGGGGGGEADLLNGVTTADMFVSKYAVFVYSKGMLPSEEEDEVPDAESGYSAGGRAEVARRALVTSEHTSLRVGDLLPDREYVAVVRASTASGKWGLWSQPVRFRTNPQFSIPVNHLSIGENYVHLVWGRDDHPIISDPLVQRGDLTVTGQQLRIQGVNTHYCKDHDLFPHLRELKVYGLSPAAAYTIQLRVCGKSGCWGLWSAPVHILTRGTILTKAVEVAEDYAVVSWERRRVPNPSHYPTGRGVVTAYHLRVFNHTGVHMETFLGDGDCPYRVTGLSPDTYYCFELKANYNDEEWGQWSTPLWCLTMQSMRIEPKLISEELCCLNITRPPQQRRLPEDDGNPRCDEKNVAFGQLRPNLMLCVTTPHLAKSPHAAGNAAKPKLQDSALPPDAADYRLIYQTELVSTAESTEHTVPNLKSNTVYSVSVRAKLPNGEWGIWAPSMLFMTVPPTSVSFTDIGENYVLVEWKRRPQVVPQHIPNPLGVLTGVGMISASQVRIRDLTGAFQETYPVHNSVTVLRIDRLSPATTYAVAVQTFNNNYDWGVWSEECRVRTVPGMYIHVQYAAEDAVWVSWTRLTDVHSVYDADTALNTKTSAKAYEVCITGPGHFRYAKEMDSNALFFRGLMPDTLYHVKVRVQFAGREEWGPWSSQPFRTKPRLRVGFGNVGEHFVDVEWRRHLPRAVEDETDALATVAESKDRTQLYRLKVQRVGEEVPLMYDLSHTVNQFRLRDLQPSSEYRVWLCACGYEGVWGLWNEETRVRTLPKLQLDVLDIGEDYVHVEWRRAVWNGATMPDHNAEVRLVEAAVSEYQVRVTDYLGRSIASQTVSHREVSCTVPALGVAELYSVQVCAKDTYDEWGLWSDPRWFVTLKTVETNLLRVGETFVDVEWARFGDLLSLPQDAPPALPSRPRQRTPGSSPLRRDDYGSTSHHHHHHPPQLSHPAIAAGADAHHSHSSPQRRQRRQRTTSILANTEDEAGDSAFPLAALSPVEEESLAGEALWGPHIDYPADAIREDETATEWHVRVQCTRLYAGLPTSEDHREFFFPAETQWCHVAELLPDAGYVVAVRAKNRVGQWGHWSPPVTVQTFPLLQLHVNVVAETFISLRWNRPAMTDTTHEDVVCFPRESDVHNYRVAIAPLEGETPFDPQDEPLVDGARVYETTQPTLRLSNLCPGTRFKLEVREQHIDDYGKAVPDSWGAPSVMQIADTVPPLRVRPAEIGEDYCLVEWLRATRESPSLSAAAVAAGEEEKAGGLGQSTDHLLSVTTRQQAVREYELHVRRLLDDGVTRYEGPLALDTVVTLPSTARRYQVENLLHSVIYEVRVRGRGESGLWGPWSGFMKFVTQSRLRLTVAAVYETDAVVTWARPLPMWAVQLHPTQSTTASTGHSTTQEGGGSPHKGTLSITAHSDEPRSPTSTVGGGATAADVTAANALLEVQMGEYGTQAYELVVRGLTSDYTATYHLTSSERVTTLAGLQQNHLYKVCVRSLSENQHWSVFSNRVSLLTLSPMEVSVKHFTETAAVVRWHRALPDVNAFAGLLDRLRQEAERNCDERERRDLFELKRRVQDLEDAEEAEQEWMDQETRLEHNALARQDAVHHLFPEHVVVGDATTTGTHFQLLPLPTPSSSQQEQQDDKDKSEEHTEVDGSDGAVWPSCAPFVQHVEALRLPVTSSLTGTGAAAAAVGSVSGAGMTAGGGALPPPPRRAAPSSAGKKRAGLATALPDADGGGGDASVPGVEDGAGFGGGAIDERAVLADGALIDVQLRGEVGEVTVMGLSASSRFALQVRARDVRLEWQPWSAQAALHTLSPITLDESRFGEHYINLFWQRMAHDTAEEIQRLSTSLRAMEVQVGQLTQRDLEVKKAELSEEVFAEQVRQLKALRELRRTLAERKRFLADGKVPLQVDPSTPLKGVQLRIVREGGTFTDHYLPYHCGGDGGTSQDDHGTQGHPHPSTTPSSAEENGDASGGLSDSGCAAFTATGLQPNHRYVCLLCPDYGNGLWGQWTKPLKFMTQNLIQLQVTYMGESFVDIEWQRLKNKRIPVLDREDTIVSDLVSEEEQVYQVRITYSQPETGEEVEEYRSMKACNVFRLDHLLPDTKYTIAVREWDAKGDWGLWCTPRTCVTLPGVVVQQDDVGEDWVKVSWARQEKRVNYDDDVHVLQYGVETVSYYLRVQEIPSGREGDSSARDWKTSGATFPLKDGDTRAGSPSTAQPLRDDGGGGVGSVGAGEPGDVYPLNQETVTADSKEDGFQYSQDDVDTVFRPSGTQRGGPLPPPAHPTEVDGVVNGHYVLIKRFNPLVEHYCVRGLHPDRVYSVEVLSETTGGQLGKWSTSRYVQTVPKLSLHVDGVEEEYVEISWQRHNPHPPPHLPKGCLYPYSYTTTRYEFEACGTGRGQGCQVRVQLDAGTRTFRLSQLALDTVYAARVRSINDKGQISLWSDVLPVVTLAPVTVQPSAITEQTITVTWSRKEQREEQYTDAIAAAVQALAGEDHAEPSETTTSGQPIPPISANATQPLCIGSRVAASYHVRVAVVQRDAAASSTPLLLLERQLSGEVRQLDVPELEPNTAYLASTRAANERGEWGQWSEERCVYTMRVLQATVAAVGEDFVRLEWSREAPEVIAPVLAATTVDSGTSTTASEASGPGGRGSVVNGVAAAAAASVTAVGKPVSFALLDRPTATAAGTGEGGVADAVYHSIYTFVEAYAVEVCRGEETEEGYSLEVGPTEERCTVPSLRPDTVFRLRVRPRYRGGLWGPWSAVVRSGTYNLLGIELRDVGEDYVAAAWQRQLNTIDLSSLQLGKVEATVCYEFVVHDFTEVPLGEEGEATLEGRDVRHVLVSSKQRHGIAKELQSNRRYRLAVRRWYRPRDAFITDAPQPLPLADNNHEELELLRSSQAVPGVWSEPEYAVTLRDMVCTDDKIGEDFFCVRWERDPRAVPLPTRHTALLSRPAQSYHIRVDELLPDGSAVDTGVDTYHVDELLPATEASFVSQLLRPDRVYRVEVRCCVDKVWGRWSRPVYLITLPCLLVDVTNICEDCAAIAWRRNYRCLTLPDGARTVTGQTDTNDKYQLEMASAGGGSFRLSKKFKGSRNGFTVKHLEPSSVYSITVRSSDSVRQTWSLWSEPVCFATLKPLQVQIGPPGEQFVRVEWHREEQCSEEFREITERSVILGDAEVTAYHLCVFCTQDTPATAVVDRQFRKDVCHYRLTSLTPDTPYVVIVRACNGVGAWGLWSEERSFRTLRLLDLHAHTIGERYVDLTWEREEAGVIVVSDVHAEVAVPAHYTIMLRSDTETLERNVPAEACGVTQDDFRLPCYRVEGLTPGSEYVVGVQPRYGGDDWGLWSTPMHFSTLPSLAVTMTATQQTAVEFVCSRAVLSGAVMATIPRTADSAVGAGVAGAKGVAAGAANPLPETLLQMTADGVASPMPRTVTKYAVQLCHRKDVSRFFEEAASSVQEVEVEGTSVKADVTPEGAAADSESGEGDRGSVAHTTSAQVTGGGAAAATTVSPSPPMSEFIPDAAVSEAVTTSSVHAVPDAEERRLTATDLVVGDAAHGSLGEGGVGSVPGRASVDPSRGENEPTLIEKVVDVVEDNECRMAFVVDGLEKDTVYAARVRAMDANGEWGPWTRQWVTTPPSAPTGVTLRRVNAQFCALQWDLVPGSVRGQYRYIIEQSYSSVGGNEPVSTTGGAASATAAAATTGGGAPSTSSNATGTLAGGGISQGKRRSGKASFAHATGNSSTTPAATNNGAAGATGGGAASSAVSSEWHVVDVVEDNVCPVRILGPLPRLRCRVKCARRGEPVFTYSEYSAAVGLSSGTPPEPVTQLRLTTLTRDSAGVEWTAPAKPPETAATTRPLRVTYRLYLSSTDTPAMLHDSVSKPVYTLTHLSPSTEYTVQVVAENTDGVSYSNPAIRFTTCAADDATTLRPSSARPSLAVAVDPNAAARDDARRDELPRIPTAKGLRRKQSSRGVVFRGSGESRGSALVPTPPSGRGPSATRFSIANSAGGSFPPRSAGPRQSFAVISTGSGGGGARVPPLEGGVLLSSSAVAAAVAAAASTQQQTSASALSSASRPMSARSVGSAKSESTAVARKAADGEKVGKKRKKAAAAAKKAKSRSLSRGENGSVKIGRAKVHPLTETPLAPSRVGNQPTPVLPPLSRTM